MKSKLVTELFNKDPFNAEDMTGSLAKVRGGILFTRSTPRSRWEIETFGWRDKLLVTTVTYYIGKLPADIPVLRARCLRMPLNAGSRVSRPDDVKKNALIRLLAHTVFQTTSESIACKELSIAAHAKKITDSYRSLRSSSDLLRGHADDISRSVEELSKALDSKAAARGEKEISNLLSAANGLSSVRHTAAIDIRHLNNPMTLFLFNLESELTERRLRQQMSMGGRGHYWTIEFSAKSCSSWGILDELFSSIGLPTLTAFGYSVRPENFAFFASMYEVAVKSALDPSLIKTESESEPEPETLLNQLF